MMAIDSFPIPLSDYFLGFRDTGAVLVAAARWRQRPASDVAVTLRAINLHFCCTQRQSIAVEYAMYHVIILIKYRVNIINRIVQQQQQQQQQQQKKNGDERVSDPLLRPETVASMYIFCGGK